MTGIAANGAFHSRGRLGRGGKALGAFKRPVPLFRAHGTENRLFILQSAVQERQLAQLLLLVHVAFVVNDNEHVLDHGGRRIDGARIVARHDHVEGIVVAGIDRAVTAPPRALLDGALAANGNLAARFCLQFLLRLAAGPDDQSDEIVIGVLLDWNGDLFDFFHRSQ